MTVSLEDGARAFWSAATYHRRDHDRDRSIVTQITKYLINNAPAPVQVRAFNLLKEIHGASEHAPRS